MVSPTQRLSEPLDVTIASGASLSAAINLQGRTVTGIIMPAAWTTANITFQAAAAEADTFVDVYATGGSEKSVTVAASRYVAIDTTDMLGLHFIKVRSGTTGTPVNQGADRTVTLMVSKVKA